MGGHVSLHASRTVCVEVRNALFENRTYAEGGRSGAFSSGCRLLAQGNIITRPMSNPRLLALGWRRYFLLVTPLVSELASVRDASRLRPSCFDSSGPDLDGDARDILGAMPLAFAIRRCNFWRAQNIKTLVEIMGHVTTCKACAYSSVAQFDAQGISVSLLSATMCFSIKCSSTQHCTHRSDS